jgi:glycylpeptide N-tetradecanoyltransferase
LLTPGYNKEWHVGVRADGKDGKSQLYGFITGTAVKNVIRGETVKMVEINFLCVHKKLREKRLGPTLIKEVTRRVNLQNIWSAFYTSGDMFPHPFSTANYFHRTLNAAKNVKTGFSGL